MYKIRIQGIGYRVQGIVCFFSIFYLLSSILSFAEDFAYNSKGKRDPFTPLIGEGAIYEVKQAVDINSIEDVSLEGILYDEKGGSSVILNGMVLKEGNKIGAVVVDKIEPKKVILLIGEERHGVELGKEKGGE